MLPFSFLANSQFKADSHKSSTLSLSFQALIPVHRNRLCRLPFPNLCQCSIPILSLLRQMIRGFSIIINSSQCQNRTSSSTHSRSVQVAISKCSSTPTKNTARVLLVAQAFRIFKIMNLRIWLVPKNREQTSKGMLSGYTICLWI